MGVHTPDLEQREKLEGTQAMDPLIHQLFRTKCRLTPPTGATDGAGVQTLLPAACNKYPFGILIVEMWACDEKRMIWRGVATDSVSIKLQEAEEQINKAMEMMFEKFPSEK